MTAPASGKDHYRMCELANGEGELRQVALGVAMDCKASDATVAQVLAEAERVLAFLRVAPRSEPALRPN